MDPVVLPPEEQERADAYALVAALLLGPQERLVQALAALADGPAAQEHAWPQWPALLAAAARVGSGVHAEYAALFVAAGTPPLNPYRCWYLEGWLMDKPLAQLRGDLRRLGLARADGASELEDHLGALCEAMRLLVLRGAPHQVQQDFFARHVAGWSARCLGDIAAAPQADFFRAVARFAAAFLRLEAQYLGLEEAGAADPSAPARHARHADDALA